METQIGNTQVQPDPNAPAAAPTAEELKARVAELEKQSEGRLRDLQNERQKRQEAESRLNPPAPSPAQPDVTLDEVGKVLKPYIDPVLQRVQRAEEFVANTYRDKAMDFLSSKTGKSKDVVLGDAELDNKLTNIVKRYGFTGNVYDVTVRAYNIMELENLQSKETERRRAADASNNSSLPIGTSAPEKVGSKEYSETDWTALPLHEYEKLADAGSFVQNERTGVITYTPNSK